MIRNILLSLLFVVSTALSGQYPLVNSEGNPIVKYDRVLTSSGPVRYNTQEEESEFLIVKSWDYTGLTLGAKTKVEMETYYDTEFYGIQINTGKPPHTIHFVLPHFWH